MTQLEIINLIVNEYRDRHAQESLMVMPDPGGLGYLIAGHSQVYPFQRALFRRVAELTEPRENSDRHKKRARAMLKRSERLAAHYGRVTHGEH